jgi:PRTRC genetic system ThiF family protein
MQITKRYPIQIGDPNRIYLILVGCGGTGSFLALHLARLAYHARQRNNGPSPSLVFIDPDVVESKNLGRQNFCPAEIGRNKARTLARRYNLAFGLDIRAHATPFHSRIVRGNIYQTFRLVIGAVDNAAARQAIQDYVTSNRQTWWLDCGNHEHAGQVVIGNQENLDAPNIDPLGLCAGLPLPTHHHPDLLEPDPAPDRDAHTESCADLALRDAQSLMINQAIAAYAAQYVYRLVLTQDLDTYATYIDLETGNAQSKPITKGQPNA